RGAGPTQHFLDRAPGEAFDELEPRDPLFVYGGEDPAVLDDRGTAVALGAKSKHSHPHSSCLWHARSVHRMKGRTQAVKGNRSAAGSSGGEGIALPECAQACWQGWCRCGRADPEAACALLDGVVQVTAVPERGP